MTRWVTFDENTAGELRSRMPSGSVFEFPGRNALEYALNSSGNLVAVLKADSMAEGQCAVAVFRRGMAHDEIAPTPSSISPYSQRVSRASGILGLGDEPVFESEEEENPRSRSWWRRLWED